MLACVLGRTRSWPALSATALPAEGDPGIKEGERHWWPALNSLAPWPQFLSSGTRSHQTTWPQHKDGKGGFESMSMSCFTAAGRTRGALKKTERPSLGAKTHISNKTEKFKIPLLLNGILKPGGVCLPQDPFNSWSELRFPVSATAPGVEAAQLTSLERGPLLQRETKQNKSFRVSLLLEVQFGGGGQIPQTARPEMRFGPQLCDSRSRGLRARLPPRILVSHPFLLFAGSAGALVTDPPGAACPARTPRPQLSHSLTRPTEDIPNSPGVPFFRLL